METVTEERRLDDRRLLVTRPRAAGPWPGVVMLHEIFGIDDVLRRQAHRLASAGYVVHCPDLLGDGPRLRCVIAMFRSFQARRGRPFQLIQAAREGAAADPACTGRVGVIGFCVGGGFALLVAPTGFDASAVNYGPVPDDVDAVLSGSCPMVASYGGRDRLVKDVPRLTGALESAGVPHDVRVYPNAGHSFLNDAANGPVWARPLARIAHVGPEPASAADAWRRIEAFFAEHLGHPEGRFPA